MSLELARDACQLYRDQDPSSRAALLRFILAGSTLQADRIAPVFRPPFNILHRLAREARLHPPDTKKTGRWNPNCLSTLAPPRAGQQANGKAALIEDTPPLPALLLLRSKSYLYQLYANRKLSARQIASLTGVSHSVVLAALDRHGIPRNGNGGHGPKRKGRLPYGFEVRDGRLVKHRPEQAVIRLIRQYHASGLSLRAIAGALNRRLVPTKHCGLWQANTVRKILARV